MRTKLSVFIALAIVAIGFLAAAGIVPAKAGIGPGDDRQMKTPTGWWTYNGVTVAWIDNYVRTNNTRLTDLQAETPTRFTVTMVSNTGVYASRSWYYVGQTAAQVTARLTANNARLISANAYSTPSGIRFAVVMVSNTGANAKRSWWYTGTPSFIASKLTAHHARLLNVSPYPGGGYLAILVDNTGSNAVRWWSYYSATESFIRGRLAANRARLIDLSRNSNGTFNVVMYFDPNTRWYWFTKRSRGPGPAPFYAPLANQLGERIIDTTSYFIGTTKYQAVIMTDNLNSLSKKLFAIINPAIVSGNYGFYLKEVGGGIFAALQRERQFEPANALSVLYHAKSIHEESLGNTNDSTSITYHFRNKADPLDGTICPDKFPTTATTNLKNADTLMMRNSDNRMTRGILDKYGKTATLQYARVLGLTQTVIAHNIGCPTPTTHNKTTLADLGMVYEAFQNGTVTGDAPWQTQFRSRMVNDSNTPGFRRKICPIVEQEAAALDKSETVATNFCNAMTWIAKSGSYQDQTAFPYTAWYASMSLTGVPYYRSDIEAITPRFFIFGEFVDDIRLRSAGELTSLNAARGKLYPEALRPYIRSALTTW